MDKQFERKKNDLRNQSGFTLIEMMCVMVMFGMILSITINRFDALSENANQKALESGIKELNIRETLVWSDFKISSHGLINDDDVFKRVDTKLGASYYWKPAVGKLGGSLHFGSRSVNLVRIPATQTTAGSWQ